MNIEIEEKDIIPSSTTVLQKRLFQLHLIAKSHDRNEIEWYKEQVISIGNTTQKVIVNNTLKQIIRDAYVAGTYDSKSGDAYESAEQYMQNLFGE